MIRLERDPAFWAGVATHAEVRHVLHGREPQFDWVQNDSVMPFASEYGGYIAVQLDAFGRVWDLHTLFTPAGWGREAFRAAATALRQLEGWQVITTMETPHPQSRPPRSFGWVPAGAFEETVIGPCRSWILTRLAWQSSNAFGKGE